MQARVKSVEMIHRSLKRAQRLIDDLLLVMRVESGRLSLVRAPLQPAHFLHDAGETLQLLASAASIHLRVDLHGELPEVVGDRDRLLQVLENLVGNAVKFTPAGGEVTVSAELSGGQVQFRVTDTGPGIPPETLPHLFDRFWRGKRHERSGAGLGLPICKGIVELHGGRCWVESTPGHGTTFFFTIPMAPGADRSHHSAARLH